MRLIVIAVVVLALVGATGYAWKGDGGLTASAAGASDGSERAFPGDAPRTPAARDVAAAAQPAHDVTVYTAPWCGWCRKTLAFLDEAGVEYVNKDIEADERWAEELREKTGGNAIPLVEIDGSRIRGFDPDRMASLLQ